MNTKGWISSVVGAVRRPADSGKGHNSPPATWKSRMTGIATKKRP